MDQVIALAQQLENTQTKEEEFLTLFTASKGVHNIFQIKDDDTVKSYWTKDLVSQFEYWKDRKNVFFTVNTARSWNRNKANTLQLNALVIDLDVYKVGMTKEQALFFLATTLKDNNIFQPTAVVDSGHGLYLYWKLTGQIANHKSLIALHEKITKVMQERLALLGADAASTDVLHLFRIPGTINHKENKERATVQVLEVNSDLIYDLQEFSDELLPVFKRKSGVIKTHFNKEKKRSVRHLYNGYTLALARAKDIEQLVQMRNYDLLGCRHRMLLYYACFLMQAHQDNYEQRVRDMNDSFLSPIRTVDDIFKVLNRKLQTDSDDVTDWSYAPRNETLIKTFDISLEEQKYLATIIDNDEYKRRQRKSRNKRYESTKEKNQSKKQERNERIVELHNKGLKNTQIAKEVGVHRNTVASVLSYHD